LIHPYAVFGEVALLTDEPRSASVVAVTPIRVWVLPRNRFDPLLRGEPELMLHLSSAVGLELARTRRVLGALQRELESWIAERLRALDPQDRDLVEAAAFFDDPPLPVLARFAQLTESGAGARMHDLAQHTPFLARAPEHAGADASSLVIPPAIRHALLRWLQAEGRTDDVRARLHALARELEREGKTSEALAAYRAAGSGEDAKRLRAAAPTPANSARRAPQSEASEAHGPAVAAHATPRKARLLTKEVAGFALALVPILFWTASPPAELSVEGWHALLTLIAAAILFATEALPEAVVALALLAAWVVTGSVTAGEALSGFATQPWILVLSVLAIGVAVGNTGLLYRVALFALGRKPAGFARRCLTLALVGTVVTPTLPNATSRTALAAPMVREVVEALGYRLGGKAAAGLALASLVGFGQMSALFLTGSSVGLLVHGILPPEIRAQFGFAGWFIAALPLHLVLFVLAIASVVALYRPAAPAADVGDRLALQRLVLGPMRRDERLCLIVLAALIGGFLTEPLHGVNAAWIGVAALVALAIGGSVDSTMLRTGVNWPFLVFFGAITSLATVFASLEIDAWLARILSAPIAALSGDSLAFCLALAVSGFALSFIVRWQAAAPLLTLVALPAASSAHVHPFLVALISIVSTHVWFLPYQSTVYLALYHGAGELFTHAHARRMALLWGVLVLISIAAALPVWRATGLAG
jgi:anion transporter